MIDRKISEIYQETITAIDKLKPSMSWEEEEKIYKIIIKNKNDLGLQLNLYVMNYEQLKSIPTIINKNIEMATKSYESVHLKTLKRKLEEEPSFIEQFNF